MLKNVLIAALAALCFLSCFPANATDSSNNSALPADASSTPFIVVDQFGYLPNAKKVAVVRDPAAGFDSQWHFAPGKAYQVVNVETGAVVFQGAPVAWHAGAVDPSSGDHAWQFDF